MERLISRRIKAVIGVWAVLLLSIEIAPVLGGDQNSHLPVPANLKDNVEFWTKIYTSYSSDEVVIHDCEYFIIYCTVDLGNHLDMNVLKDSNWGKVKAEKIKYENALHRLSRLSKIDTLKLSPIENKIYKLWSHVDNQKKFIKACRNIRAQRGLNDHFRTGLERSGRYIKYIESTLENHGVPKELAALPMVESSFNTRAYSKMGAAGIWQFTRGTGRLFLTVNYTIDERFDPIKSTKAAAQLLKLNYDELGTWPLAITAYNHGLGGMKRAKRMLKTDDFGSIVDRYESRSFGFASKNFYAEFIAAKNVWANYRRYFGEITFQKPTRNECFEIPDFVKLSTLTEHFNLDLKIVKDLNPALRKPVLESKRYIPKGYQFQLPLRNDFDTQLSYAQIPDSKKYNAQVRDRYYKIRRGDTLSKIAGRYRTSVKSLMAMNSISNPHRIRIGQTIEIPPSYTFVAKSESSDDFALAEIKPKQVPGGGIKSENIKSSSELQIATNTNSPKTGVQQNNVPTIVEDNIETQEKVAPILDSMLLAELHGPLLAAQSEPQLSEKSESLVNDPLDIDSLFFQVPFEQPISESIIVQPQETLGHFADWLGLKTQSLRSLNGFSYSKDIQVGQRITVSFDRVTKEEFHRRRTEYHRGIQEDFFSRYRILGERVHTIKPGENIWQVCNRLYDVPYWLLARYNSNKDLTQLHPGDTIIIPDITVRTAISKSLSGIKTTLNPPVLPDPAKPHGDAAN